MNKPKHEDGQTQQNDQPGPPCLARHDGYICTLDSDHNGAHEARDDDGIKFLFTWPAVDCTYVEADALTLSITRPAWMTDQRWIEIAEKIDDKVDELTDAGEAQAQTALRDFVAAQPANGCSEHPWCFLGTRPEHMEHHASDCLDLAGVERDETGAAVRGWWCWMSQDRGVEDPTVTFEGRYTAATPAFCFDISAGRVLCLLDALGPRDARVAMHTLLSLGVTS